MPSRDSWWWSEEVQEKVKAKRVCYLEWRNNKYDEPRANYKETRTDVKKAGEAKIRAFENVYRKLNTKEGEKEL